MREQKYSRLPDLIWWIFLCSSCMGIMLFFAAGKTITIENVARDTGELAEMMDAYPDRENMGISLNLQEDSQVMRICIPLENGLKADKVTMENRYMDKELWIYIQGGSRGFYDDQVIYGDISQVNAGYYETLQDGVLLKFLLNGVYEYSSILESNCLYIDMVRPGDLYQQIVVVDPGYMEGDTDVALSVAQSLKKRLEKTDVKVYFTRLDGQDIPIEKRADLANELQADMFIGIGCSEDKDKTKYGLTCLYNGSYFIPLFGNVELADILERNVVTSVSGRALGLEAASEESVLSLVKVPAAVIQVGYLTHSKEGELLRKPEYAELLAQGIEAAIREAYE